MKPILVLALFAAVASPALAAGPMAGSGGGTLKASSGTFGGARSTAPTYGSKPIGGSASTTPRRYGETAPIGTIRSPAPLGEDRFKPYEGKSVYSNRGGVNAYPDPAKPKGYIDPNGKRRF